MINKIKINNIKLCINIIYNLCEPQMNKRLVSMDVNKTVIITSFKTF